MKRSICDILNICGYLEIIKITRSNEQLLEQTITKLLEAYVFYG